jgi:hypothetical protein
MLKCENNKNMITASLIASLWILNVTLVNYLSFHYLLEKRSINLQHIE